MPLPPPLPPRTPARRGVRPLVVAQLCVACLAVGVGAGYVLPRGGAGGGAKAGAPPAAGGGAKAGSPATGVRGWVPKEVAEFVIQKLGGDLEYTTADYPFVSRISPKGSEGGLRSELQSGWPHQMIEFYQPGDDEKAERARRNHSGRGVMLTKANWVFVTDATTAARLRPVLEQLPQ